MIGTLWLDSDHDGISRLIPDFNHPRKCRDFDTVRQWAYDHQIEGVRLDAVPTDDELILKAWP